jgi:sphingolipid delta-4 desaturase
LFLAFRVITFFVDISPFLSLLAEGWPMSLPARDFQYSDAPEPHRERTKRLLQNHPEVRSLIGRNPLSALLVVLLVALQIALAGILGQQPWWLGLLVAYVAGAFANHALFVLIHECAHNLVFRRRAANILLSILADLPNVVPSAVSFRSYHLKHHSFQGHYELDADLASRWEANLIGNSFIGKTLWLLFFPVFQSLRPPRLSEIPFLNAWTVVNWVVVFGFDLFVAFTFGPAALLYLLESLFFAVGLHPLGARWIQEHYLVSPPQETYSYYGPLNTIALNVGFHNEHHDLPSVPWNNLPRLKRAAPELYENLVGHRSWTRLLWRFLTDRNLSLYSRILRSDRGGIGLQAEG